jgi:hypothetical protein
MIKLSLGSASVWSSLFLSDHYLPVLAGIMCMVLLVGVVISLTKEPQQQENDVIR